MAELSIERCRTLLGHLAEGKTDEQVETLRDTLAVAANTMYDTLVSHLRGQAREASEDDHPDYPSRTLEESQRDAIERIRWIAYARENPLEAPEKTETEVELDRWAKYIAENPDDEANH
jgi:hypothetical protein